MTDIPAPSENKYSQYKYRILEIIHTQMTQGNAILTRQELPMKLQIKKPTFYSILYAKKGSRIELSLDRAAIVAEYLSFRTDIDIREGDLLNQDASPPPHPEQ